MLIVYTFPYVRVARYMIVSPKTLLNRFLGKILLLKILAERFWEKRIGKWISGKWSYCFGEKLDFGEEGVTPYWTTFSRNFSYMISSPHN